MDRMIYVGMAGAKMDMQRQEVLSNNLANVSTTGFRAELQAVRAVPVRGDGATTRVYALETTVGYDDTSGPLSFTGRNLDVAMQGRSRAWMAPRPTPALAPSRSTQKAPSRRKTATPSLAMAGRSPYRPTPSPASHPMAR
jgi:Flagella basal body rod protein